MLLGWDLAVLSANTEACQTFWQQWSGVSSFSSRSALEHSRTACVGFSYRSEKGKKYITESGPTTFSLPWHLQMQRVSLVLTIVNYIVTNYDLKTRCLQHWLEKKSGTILPGFYFYELKHPDLLWRWLECNLASCGLLLKCFPCPLNAWYVRSVSSFSAETERQTQRLQSSRVLCISVTFYLLFLSVSCDHSLLRWKGGVSRSCCFEKQLFRWQYLRESRVFNGNGRKEKSGLSMSYVFLTCLSPKGSFPDSITAHGSDSVVQK